MRLLVGPFAFTANAQRAGQLDSRHRSLPRSTTRAASVINTAHAQTMGAAQAKARGDGDEQYTIRVRHRWRYVWSSNALTRGVYRSASVF